MAIGSDNTNINFSIIYVMITIVMGAVPTILSTTLAHLIRSIGKSKVASSGIIMGIIFNMVIDPLLMFVILPPGYEVVGTAIGTLLSNILSTLFFVVYICRHKDKEILSLKNTVYKDSIF